LTCAGSAQQTAARGRNQPSACQDCNLGKCSAICCHDWIFANHCVRTNRTATRAFSVERRPRFGAGKPMTDFETRCVGGDLSHGLTRTLRGCSGTFRRTNGSHCCIWGSPQDGPQSRPPSIDTGSSLAVPEAALPGPQVVKRQPHPTDHSVELRDIPGPPLYAATGKTQAPSCCHDTRGGCPHASATIRGRRGRSPPSWSLEGSCAALEVRVKSRLRASPDHKRIGTLPVLVRKLHRTEGSRARDAVSIRLLPFQAVLAQHLVERSRFLRREIGVIRLFDHREGCEDFGGHDICEQPARKRHSRALTRRNSSIALPAVARRNSVPPLTKLGSNVSSVNGR